MLQTKSGSVALGREQELTIGRDPQCDVVIDDPRVSRFHATLEWHRGIVVLRDHSTNGSFVRHADETRAHFVRREVLRIRGAGELNFGAAAPLQRAVPLRMTDTRYALVLVDEPGSGFRWRAA